MTPKRAFFYTCLNIPQFNRFIPTATRQKIPLRAQGNGLNRVGMSGERANFLTTMPTSRSPMTTSPPKNRGTQIIKPPTTTRGMSSPKSKSCMVWYWDLGERERRNSIPFLVWVPVGIRGRGERDGLVLLPLKFSLSPIPVKFWPCVESFSVDGRVAGLTWVRVGSKYYAINPGRWGWVQFLDSLWTEVLPNPSRSRITS